MTTASSKTESAQIADNKVADNKKSQVTHLLYALQFALEDFQTVVHNTTELYKVDVKTPLTKNIEEHIDNPLGSLYSMSNNIDSQCISLIDKIATKYFSSNKNIISSVYRTNNKGHLHYAIVLKKETSENRNAVFNFFDLSTINEALQKYPVYFQFTTDSTISKTKEKIPDIFKIPL